MLGQRRRRWTSIDQALDQRPLFARMLGMINVSRVRETHMDTY